MTRETFTLRFKEPVTTRLFVAACEACGVDADLAWQKPLAAAEVATSNTDLTLDDAQRFLDVVLAEPIDLDDMPQDRAEAVAAYAISGASGFFAHQRGQYFDEHIKPHLD